MCHFITNIDRSPATPLVRLVETIGRREPVHAQVYFSPTCVYSYTGIVSETILKAGWDPETCVLLQQ